jgi:hypothetical protein
LVPGLHIPCGAKSKGGQDYDVNSTRRLIQINYI